MNNPPLRGCSCFRLRRLTRRITRHYDHYLASAGLTVTQYGLLSLLLDGGGSHTVGSIAQSMDMDRTSLTRTLKPMAAHGWITISPSGRQRLIAITPAGHTVRMDAKPAWRRAQDAFNATLGDALVGNLHQVLDVVNENFRLAPSLEEIPE